MKTTNLKLALLGVASGLTVAAGSVHADTAGYSSYLAASCSSGSSQAQTWQPRNSYSSCSSAPQGQTWDNSTAASDSMSGQSNWNQSNPASGSYYNTSGDAALRSSQGNYSGSSMTPGSMNSGSMNSGSMNSGSMNGTAGANNQSGSYYYTNPNQSNQSQNGILNNNNNSNFSKQNGMSSTSPSTPSAGMTPGVGR